jgi:cell wall assembly regulator SMI1
MLVKELWDRMEKWLKQNNPEILESLHPGASEDEIQSLESKLGVKLPSDLRDSLKIHNGQQEETDGLIGNWELLSVERILEEWNVWNTLYERGDFKEISAEPDDGVRDTWWNPKWIPLTYSGRGDHHCMDLSPAPDGTYGQIITMWHDEEERRLLAPSFSMWFEKVVTICENNDLEDIYNSDGFLDL